MQFPKTTVLILAAMQTAQAFVVRPAAVPTSLRMMMASGDDKAAEAVFVPPAEEGDSDEDDTLEKAESLGRGAAKVSY